MEKRLFALVVLLPFLVCCGDGESTGRVTPVDANGNTVTRAITFEPTLQDEVEWIAGEDAADL